jgi:S1-C subfamily serine protease
MTDERIPGMDEPEAGGANRPEPPATLPPATLPPAFPPPPGGWDLWVTPAPTTTSEEVPTRRRGRVILAAVLATFLLLGGIGIGWGLTRGFGGNAPTGTGAPLTAVQPSVGHADQALNVQAVAAQVEPAVVDINTTILVDASGRTAEAAGTGMIVTSNGQVLTNNHVIRGATSIQVTIEGHSGTFIAKVVGVDPTDDVALLQIQGVSNLPTVTLADSSNLSVGQDVVAIGNALGQGGSPTVTQGSISSLGQSITVSDGRGGTESLNDVIEMDAPIQPGDSGGPLVNAAGQVVGMITAGSREGRSQSASTVGFAITSNNALSVVNEIRAGHSSSKIIIGQAGFLGIEVQNLDAAAIARLGLNVTSGALVVGVFPGSPAAGAGMSTNSVITAINGAHVASADALGPIIHQYKSGDQIQVTWVDQHGSHTSSVRLIDGPAV